MERDGIERKLLAVGHGEKTVRDILIREYQLVVEFGELQDTLYYRYKTAYYKGAQLKLFFRFVRDLYQQYYRLSILESQPRHTERVEREILEAEASIASMGPSLEREWIEDKYGRLPGGVKQREVGKGLLAVPPDEPYVPERFHLKLTGRVADYNQSDELESFLLEPGKEQQFRRWISRLMVLVPKPVTYATMRKYIVETLRRVSIATDVYVVDPTPQWTGSPWLALVEEKSPYPLSQQPLLSVQALSLLDCLRLTRNCRALQAHRDELLVALTPMPGVICQFVAYNLITSAFIYGMASFFESLLATLLDSGLETEQSLSEVAKRIITRPVHDYLLTVDLSRDHPLGLCLEIMRRVISGIVKDTLLSADHKAALLTGERLVSAQDAGVKEILLSEVYHIVRPIVTHYETPLFHVFPDARHE